MGLAELDFSALVDGRLVAVAFPGAGDVAADLRKAGAADVLLLRWRGPRQPVRRETRVEARMRRAMHLTRNNCQVAILSGAAGFALFNKTYFARPRFETLMVPLNLSLLAALPGILRYRRKKRLEVMGITRFRAGTRARRLLVLRNNVALPSNRRLHGPTGMTPLEILNELKGVDYVLLRWPDDVEQDRAIADLDILVADDDLEELRARLSRQVGTFPLDVYAESGRDGFNMQNVPYFVPSMARAMLESAKTRASGVRAPSAKWRYLSMAYHLVFHGKSRKVPPGTQALDETLYASPKHVRELARLAKEAKLPAPRTYDDLDAALRAEGVFPGRDLIGFYSRRNPFVKERYLEREKRPPGLATFFVRDFGDGLAPLEGIEKTLKEHFLVVAHGPVTDDNRAAVTARVRGGNWFDKEYRGVAPPIYWFVCRDENPKAPSGKVAKENPRWDNANLALKFAIRAKSAARAGARSRVVHASDNTAEALEHIAAIGVADDKEVAKAIGQLGIR